MYFILGLVGEVVTVVGSFGIMLNDFINSILEIPEQGYLIDKEDLDNYKSKAKEKKKEKKETKKNKFSTIMELVPIFIPGINLIYAKYVGLQIKNTVRSAVKDSDGLKDVLIPMTEDEKEQFSKLKGKIDKIAFMTNTDKEHKFVRIGKRSFVVDLGLNSIHYDKLTPLNYTLDEVKRLNEATTYSYRIGKMENQNVAIIGIPNSDAEFKRIQLKSEDYKLTHDFISMTDEEAEGKTFVVYPFSVDDDIRTKLDQVVEEIKKSRETATPVVTKQHIAPVLDLPYEDTSERQSDVPVLHKTIFPKN